MLELEDQQQETEMAVKSADLKGMSGKALQKLIADAQALQQEQRGERINELRTKWNAEAEEEGLSVLDILGIRQETKKGRSKGDGTRKPAELKYKRPNGELWGGRGRLPLDIREALDGAEGFDVKKGTFDTPEGREKALSKFLV